MNGKTGVRASAGLVVFLCFLVATIEGFDIQAFGVASPRLVRDLGMDPGQQGWAGAAAMIGLMIGAIGGGWMADRIGRKPVLLLSVAAFGGFSLATAASPLPRAPQRRGRRDRRRRGPDRRHHRPPDRRRAARGRGGAGHGVPRHGARRRGGCARGPGPGLEDAALTRGQDR